jgi:hypothetical protein
VRAEIFSGAMQKSWRCWDILSGGNGCSILFFVPLPFSGSDGNSDVIAAGHPEFHTLESQSYGRSVVKFEFCNESVRCVQGRVKNLLEYENLMLVSDHATTWNARAPPQCRSYRD